MGLMGVLETLQDPEARGHFLNAAAAAENADGVFDDILEQIDPRFRSAVLLHRKDEELHTELLRRRVQDLGVTPYDVRPEHNLFLAIGAAIGHTPPVSVGAGYTWILVGEELAVWQYSLLAPLFEQVGDGMTTLVLDRIIEDEKRHVRLCLEIVHRYDVSIRSMARARAIASRVFLEWSKKILRREQWPT